MIPRDLDPLTSLTCKALLFDLDGTLVDSHGADRACMARLV